MGTAKPRSVQQLCAADSLTQEAVPVEAKAAVDGWDATIDGMKCPFPGMDPYLEHPGYWPDFHRSFIPYIRDALLDRLPGSYDARIDEHLRLVEYDDVEMQRVYPDVSVLHTPPNRGEPTGRPVPPVATLEPVTVPAPVMAEVRDVWIEIRHVPDSSVVTVIELLSPSNKIGEGYHEYRAKRQAILGRPVSLVEIDLLLGGRRIHLPGAPETSYAVFVSRADRRESVDIFGWNLRDPLPSIPIPLRPPDADVVIPLGELFAVAYERGRYARALRYDQPPPTQLPQEDSEWARRRLDGRPSVS